MKALVQRINANPIYAKAFHWGKMITIAGSAQVLIQVIGLVCGILVIRLLSTHEYALFTLVNTILGTMTVLADGGISTGVMAQGGVVWQDREKLGVVISTGFNLRRKFAIGSLLIFLPVLLYLLLHHGASWLMSVIIILSIIPVFLGALSDMLLEIAPKLRQDIAKLQINQIKANTGRLILTAVFLIIFPWAFIAVLASGLPRIWANLGLRKISAGYADLTQSPDENVNKKILASVKRLLPGAIYYCFLGQITIWLISIFGSTASIAQIGALGRISALISILNIIFATIILPRFIRLPTIKKLLLQRYTIIISGLVIISIFITALVYLFTSEILWILGKNYAELSFELLLAIIGSCLSLISSCIFSLNINRGWIVKPIISIPISIISIILSASILNISTLQGILILNIIASIIHILLFACHGYINIFTSKDL